MRRARNSAPVLGLRVGLERHFAAWPASVRGPLVERHLATWRVAGRENTNLYEEVAEELRHAPATPDVPVTVLSAVGHDATQAHLWPEGLLREINACKLALHAELAAEGRYGTHRVLHDAGHGWIHEERPDAVLQAVAELLNTGPRREGGRAGHPQQARI